MNLNKNGTWLFAVETKEEFDAIHAWGELKGLVDAFRCDWGRYNNTALIFEGGTTLYNPSEDTLKKGIYIDVAKVMEEYKEMIKDVEPAKPETPDSITVTINNEEVTYYLREG